MDEAHLHKMGLWVTSPINDPQVPEADRQVLATAACDGWLWRPTPDEELRLVHATARPAVPPKISRLTAAPRAVNMVTANLDGVLDVHGISTDKIELRAEWTEPIDEPSASEPTAPTTNEVVVDYQIDAAERFSLVDPAAQRRARRRARRRRADQESHSHVPRYQDPHGNLPTARQPLYREFFGPDELPTVHDPWSLGNEVAVTIPSSAVPARPVVHDVIPMFLWEQTTEPQHPFAIRRIRRSGVRIWLDRPWYSSGDGELLAIIATGDPALAEGKTDSVSLWARDRILLSSKIANSYEVPVLAAWQQRAVQLNLVPESLPGRPELHAVKAGTPADGDKVINAYAYTPEIPPRARTLVCRRGLRVRRYKLAVPAVRGHALPTRFDYRNGVLPRYGNRFHPVATRTYRHTEPSG